MNPHESEVHKRNEAHREMLRRHIQEQFTWVDDPEHTFQDTMLIYLLMHLGGIEQVLTGILDRLGGDVKSAYPYKRNGDEDL